MGSAQSEVVILGTGGHAKVVIEILEAIGGYRIRGLLWADTDPTRRVRGYEIIGDNTDWPTLVAEGVSAAIGVGGWTDNSLRRETYEAAIAAGFSLETCIHPAATVSPSASIGIGGVIFPGAIIHTEVDIGDNSIVATGATIDHESVVGDHALVSAGVSVGARVRVGTGALLAIGSTVASGVSIGANALVAAGAVVVDDIPDGVRVFGVPARPHRLSRE